MKPLPIALVALISIATTDSRAADPAASTLVVHIQGQDWNASSADIDKVVHSAAAQILCYFPDRQLQPILLLHWQQVPITLDQKGPAGEYQVRLTAHST